MIPLDVTASRIRPSAHPMRLRAGIVHVRRFDTRHALARFGSERLRASSAPGRRTSRPARSVLDAVASGLMAGDRGARREAAHPRRGARPHPSGGSRLGLRADQPGPTDRRPVRGRVPHRHRGRRDPLDPQPGPPGPDGERAARLRRLHRHHGHARELRRPAPAEGPRPAPRPTRWSRPPTRSSPRAGRSTAAGQPRLRPLVDALLLEIGRALARRQRKREARGRRGRGCGPRRGIRRISAA